MQQEKKRARLILVFITLLALVAGLFVWPQATEKLGLPRFPSKPFQLGLDIAGGTSLTYRADLENIPESDRGEAMEGLRDVVEQRVNLFGVREPRVEVAKTPVEWRLNVELAGVKDINEAIRLIGATPFLEFKEERTQAEAEEIIQALASPATPSLTFATVCQSQILNLLQFIATYGEDPCYRSIGLTGKYLSRAQVGFDPTSGLPEINLQFNDEGTKLLADFTSRNVGRMLGIYLDGIPRQIARINEPILQGGARITGVFTPEEARDRVRELNQGALPVPITLISQRSISAILGEEALSQSIFAGLIGFLFVALFMIFFYRLSGVLAVVALLVYAAFALAVFKLIPVTLTLAGIAGFVLSVGMAVDANILIFERTKEELRSGKGFRRSLGEGFSRAWPSIRDSNISTILTSIVLYTFATSIVKGFALTLLLGVLLSMFSAIFVTRFLLLVFLPQEGTISRWWFGVRGSAPRE
jgi:protein-export membrane protein SecD